MITTVESDPEKATAAQKEEAGVKIRSLLGRRLTRSSRGSEANAYFPPELRTIHASFITALVSAWSGPDTTTRAAMTNALSLVSDGERKRWQVNRIDPEERFHYRYTAGDLAWAAAQFMPDNSDETARVLCMAGTWIKYRNPKEADRFYKALVRRCRKTEMGRLADKRRWFPEIDNDGRLLPPPVPKPENTEPQEQESTEAGVSKD